MLAVLSNFDAKFRTSPRSFIPDSDSSTGDGLFIIEGEAEMRTRSQCHADGTTMSKGHLAELRAFIAFSNLESNL
jgi:hypothetical protein